ncbi:amino acid adenylation domain-containing protein [Gordonia sp. NB41Y]|uniref:amino acid adenylation domain-containing protein n=1 Tax=Gordonia sp. NB41Y TaxID=875808 RepID=UPI00273C5FFA|nr:amino acid adenylation domain-containing protein [Gordonia sp. NB41Y]WLP90907.1 amino acid adenylation domain-containing protein [Gordonia sp. NB41Y]
MSVVGVSSCEPLFAASAAAQGLWVAQSVIGPSPVFTIGQVLEFTTAPDTTRLVGAATAAAAEADLLSARFIDDDSGPHYRLGDPIPVRHIDLGADPRALAQHCADAVGRPIDPVAGPCAEISILTAGASTGLLVVAHHLVLDAYGLGLLVRRIGRLYDDPTDTHALRPVTGLPAGIDAPRADDQEFWARELTGVAGPLTLSGTPRGHRIAARVHTRRSVIAGAGALARTPASLTAVVAAFCARRADTDDVVLGFPMMNRLGSPAAASACSTVNVIPLRIAAAGSSTLEEIGAHVTEQIRAVGPHARYRGEQIVRDLRHRGVDGANGPTLNIKPFSSTVTIGGHAATIRSLARGPVVDMAITCADIDGDLEIMVDADTELYDEAAVEEICAELTEAVTAVATTPELTGKPIGAWHLAADRARATAITADDERTRRPIGTTRLVDRALAHPDDTVALVFGAEQVRVADLRRRVDALAGRLGVLGPEDIVAVALPRGIDLIVALLAVHRSGAAFLPLDPGFPADRLAATLADAGPVAVLEPGPDGIAIGRPDGADPSRADRDVVPSHDLRSPAYVIYTSGSTGTPKGVVLDHRALLNFTEDMIDLLGYRPGRSVLAVTTISFDIAILETLVPLAAGATVVLATADDVHDPDRLARIVTTHGVDVMQATPSLWSALLESGHGSALAGVDVLVGGESVPAELAAELAGHAASVRNMYGPTETTIWSTTAPLTGHDVPIGEPIANTGVRLLDSALRPVGDGRVGELYLSGDGLARGYHGKPDLTFARFVADPFGPPGARMYRTGDLARRGADGVLYCLGRTDHQVKIRGFRIELGDVDTALAQHDSVDRAVTTAFDGRLVAFIKPAAGHEVDVRELRAHLTDRLPDYMIPAAVMAVDEFPLTPNGKVDRRALPRPVFGSPAGDSRPPATDTERALAQAFSEVLGVPAVGADDDFFLLGGDSLTAVRVVTRLARDGLRITPIELFDNPTVAGLATVATTVATARPDPDAARPADGEFALTTAGIGADELDDLADGDLL